MTPQQVRGPAVRERLLDAAETLFYTHGITGTGVDAVLREAGVSTATLYAHFGGKDALVAGYLQRRTDRWRATWGEAVDAATTPEDRLLAVFDALAAFRADQPGTRGCAVLAAAVEIPGSGGGGGAAAGPAAGAGHPALDVIAADTAYLRERLRSLATDLPVADPDELAEQVLLVYDGTLAAYLRGASGDPLARGRALAALIVHKTVQSTGNAEETTV